MARVVRQLSVAVFLFTALLTQVGAQSEEDCRMFGTYTGSGCAASPSPYSDCVACVFYVCNEEFGGENSNCATYCRSAGYPWCV